MWKKQILKGLLESKKKKWGSPRIFQRQLNNHDSKKALKYECMAISFQLSLKDSQLHPIFFFDSEISFFHIVINRAKNLCISRQIR